MKDFELILKAAHNETIEFTLHGAQQALDRKISTFDILQAIIHNKKVVYINEQNKYNIYEEYSASHFSINILCFL